MSPKDPYFNRIGLQLIHPPDSSCAVIEEAVKGLPFLIQPGAEFPIESAMSYVQEFLTDVWQPPTTAPFVPFPNESSQCDVIRVEYQISDVRVKIAQSYLMIAIVIEGFRFKTDASDVERAQAVAKAVLQTPVPVEFEAIGPFEGGAYGVRRLSSSGPVDDEWPHWTDELRWWYVKGTVGFITLKATGGPTMAEIGPDEDLNRQWF